MRVIQVSKDGVIELSWMFLPTFIGQNYAVQLELQDMWSELFPNGVLYTDELLDKLNDETIAWFANKFPAVKGLREYLEGIKHVQQDDKVS